MTGYHTTAILIVLGSNACLEVLLELGRLEGRSSCPATVVTLSLTARRYEAGLNTLVKKGKRGGKLAVHPSVLGLSMETKKVANSSV